MKEVLKQAERLGESIANSERYQRLKDLKARIERDSETSQLLADYQAVTRKLDEAGGNAAKLPERERHKLAALERKIRENTTIQELLRAQADFAELMSKVHRALETSIESCLNSPA